MDRWTYYNDRFVPEAECRLPVGDLAVQRGYGIFDFFKTRGGAPVFIEDHLARFYRSAEVMRLRVGKTAPEVKTIITELMTKNAIPDSGIRLTLTGGISPDGYSLGTPNFIITQQPLQLPTTTAFEQGIRLATYQHQRQLPHVKTIDYMMSMWLQPWLVQSSAEDVLYHQNGMVSECPRANFFIVREGIVATPGQHVLKGINRNKVLQLAGNNAVERTLLLDELARAEEAFITSTTKQVLPVIAIDNRIIGDGQPGPITRHFAEQLETLVKSQTQAAPQAF